MSKNCTQNSARGCRDVRGLQGLDGVRGLRGVRGLGVLESRGCKMCWDVGVLWVLGV